MMNQNSQNLLSSLFSAQDSIIYPFLEQSPSPWDLFALLAPLFKEDSEVFSSKFPFVHWKDKEKIFTGKDVIIEPGALIEGPCYIGDRVRIGHGATIRAGSFLAPGAYIGHCSEITRSIFFEGAKAPHFNYVGDSIIGTNVNLGSHAVLANLRLDHKDVRLLWDDALISTGKRKFGSLVGDHSAIGAGSVLNPGTIVMPGGKIPPLTVQKGCI
ncbi:MAG: Bifunctional protein GlmU [Chlamydiia bacterium]|nr:Bifunctional protein GlmU [Chlamydiia bacterium]